MYYEILDPQRIQRLAQQGRKIEWPCSLRTHMRFRDLLTELVELELADQRDPEVQNRMAGLRDDIRHLPGYPSAYDIERDVIVPVTTTAMR